MSRDRGRIAFRDGMQSVFAGKFEGAEDMRHTHEFKSVERIVYAAVAALIIIVCAVCLQRQQASQTSYTKELFAMDTFFSLRAYGPGAEEALAACEGRVEELESLLSVTREGSDIQRMNQGEHFAVSGDTFSVITSALELGGETEGTLDITLYPVLREWGFTTGEYQIPQAETLQALLEKVDYRTVSLDDSALTVSVPEGVELDLGAVAKGYTGDCLLTLLKERGVTSAMLDLCGNIQVLGEKPDGSAWRVAVRNPFDMSNSLGVLEVRDKSVITSGNYERYFVGEDGNIYGHILNPSDGYPADSGLAAVTIVGDSGVRCDGLSTALFVMGKDAAVDYWQQHRDFEMLLVTEDAHLYMTEGLTECFACSEDWDAEIIRGE
ncbi:MAG: FAD:protein FMN transferase [Acetatifactor sp.]|nr:FAD:protein FMN transferase [Acetatifactor sp.]